jgi:hypothetical protein
MTASKPAPTGAVWLQEHRGGAGQWLEPPRQTIEQSAHPPIFHTIDGGVFGYKGKMKHLQPPTPDA